ncbi:MAG: BrxA/BrxB family bacilliredoxin [Vicinamibacterales bacterium]
MAYPDWLTAPMRKELTDVGARELRSAADVDAIVGEPGVVMMVVNSVCGCAAGKARPGIAKALEHANRPDVIGTVFAGADVDATDRARSYFTGFPPSSPSIALLRGGKLLYLMERKDIEVSSAERIADQLTLAFDEHCSTAAAR